MTASYADLGQIARSDEFQRRVSIAMNNAAQAVYSESTSVTGHVARATFANKVVTGQYNLSAACLALLAQSTLMSEAVLATSPGNAIPDADIQTIANSMWNTFAGA